MMRSWGGGPWAMARQRTHVRGRGDTGRLPCWERTPGGFSLARDGRLCGARWMLRTEWWSRSMRTLCPSKSSTQSNSRPASASNSLPSNSKLGLPGWLFPNFSSTLLLLDVPLRRASILWLLPKRAVATPAC